jgi:outer membrane immunogenic protein
MLKKSGVLAAAVASLLWSGAALAEGCHYGAFNGAYIGASIGYVGLDAKWTSPGEPKLSNDDGSFIGGGHVGYNVQCGRIVFGVEGDISFMDVETRGVQQSDLTTLTTEMDTLATLRGRLGVTIHDNVLLYGTAGVAWADRTHHLVAPNAPGGRFTQSDSDWATGWVVGGGVEFMRDNRWSVRAEVLYADLGSETHTYTMNAGSSAGSGGCTSVCRAKATWDDEIWTARVGVSLKLGGDPAPQYEPLK